MFSRLWWELALRRMVRSTAQAFIFTVSSDATGLLELDWGDAVTILVGWPLLTFAHYIVQTPEEAKKW